MSQLEGGDKPRRNEKTATRKDRYSSGLLQESFGPFGPEGSRECRDSGPKGPKDSCSRPGGFTTLQDSAIIFSAPAMGESTFYCANHRVSCKCRQPPPCPSFTWSFRNTKENLKNTKDCSHRANPQEPCRTSRKHSQRARKFPKKKTKETKTPRKRRTRQGEKSMDFSAGKCHLLYFVVVLESLNKHHPKSGNTKKYHAVGNYYLKYSWEYFMQKKNYRTYSCILGAPNTLGSFLFAEKHRLGESFA